MARRGTRKDSQDPEVVLKFPIRKLTMSKCGIDNSGLKNLGGFLIDLGSIAKRDKPNSFEGSMEFDLSKNDFTDLGFDMFVSDARSSGLLRG